MDNDTDVCNRQAADAPHLQMPGKLQRSDSARDEFSSASLPWGRGGRVCPRAGSPWGVVGSLEELPRSIVVEERLWEW